MAAWEIFLKEGSKGNDKVNLGQMPKTLKILTLKISLCTRPTCKGSTNFAVSSFFCLFLHLFDSEKVFLN